MDGARRPKGGYRRRNLDGSVQDTFDRMIYSRASSGLDTGVYISL